MPKFSFEKFTQVGGVFAPMISVRKDGAIGVSQGALRKFELLEGEWFLVLHFDRQNNVIGILPTRNGNEEGAIKLLKRPTSGKGGQQSVSAAVSAKAFLEYYGINTAETRTYRAERDDESGFIVLQLSSPEKEEKNEEEAVTEGTLGLPV